MEEGASSLSEGSVLGANNIYLQAGRDISVTGSHVVGQGDVGLVAGRDVQLLAGQDSAAATSHSETKKSGLFSGGGFGITLGSKSVTIDRSNESVRAAGSSVQAQGGNASIVAGNQYRQTGSAVLAQGDVNIVGKSVEINEARELERDKFEMRAKQSGLSVSISNPVVNVVQGGETVARIAGATGKTSDARMQALGAAAAGMAAYETYGKASQLIADPSSATSVGISLSLGKSSSRSTSEYQVNSAVGSLVKADGNVSITATQGDVHVRGSSVEAGKDVRLAADKGNIVLEAAENRFAEQNSQSSSSASVGVAFTLGSKNGFSVNVGLSQGKGSGSGESLSHTNTHIKAGGTASVQSGGDTTLKGATIVADTVKADIGGNLAIESLQDKSTYNEKSSSAGLNVSLCVPPLCYGPSSVGGSAGRTRIDSDYQSVVEQSGIRAGDGGFDVKVKGDTTLKGGAITSTQVAMDDGKNRFETGGKLTTSDIENHAAYDASGWSAGGSVGFQAGDQSTAKTEEQKKAALDTGKGLTGGSAGVGSDSGNASSTTKAGISGVAGDSGARTGDKETGLKPIFDKDKVRENVNAQIEITREFGKQGSAAWGNYATRQYAEALKNQDAEAAECWGPSGACRAVGHALIGGATGGVGGAAAGGFTSLTAPQAQALLRGAGLPEPVVDALVQGYALGAGAGIGGAPGAAAGANEASNNAVAPFAINVLLEGGALALAGCYALPACAKNIAPQMEQYLASLTKEQVASAVGQSWMRGCGLIPMCTLSLIAQGVDPRLLGVQGKPETPAPGPNHTGGDQTRNPNPGGGTTTTPNDGPKGGLGPNGKPIADPSDTTTVTPIPEPQGPQLVLSEKKNGGSVSALPGAAPGVNEIKGADALADNGFNVVHQPTNSSQNQPGRKADYYVEGIGQVDEYSPDPSTELPNMARAIEKKNKQGNGVMVQKDLTDYEIEILSNMVWKKPNAKNIDTLIFNSNGKLKVLKRPK
ncbi:hemagglutinin repeat-containing protein [Delftia acidovorans]|uniref:hemagglutinin repeat-containing protein n=1 Tax=Delftia acidovorans TaxID=80866 RepID=UPI00359FFC9E